MGYDNFYREWSLADQWTELKMVKMYVRRGTEEEDAIFHLQLLLLTYHLIHKQVGFLGVNSK